MARSRPIDVPPSGAPDPAGLARDELLLLPDGGVLLDALDAAPAGLERLGPVGSRAGHDDRDLPDGEVARAVEQRHAPDRPPLEQLASHIPEAGLGELGPRLVVQAGNVPLLGVVAD